MTEVRVLSATGMLGSGFMESSFERGISLKTHVIGCDAGSTDGGPAYLGAGDRYFSKEATKRDLRLMLTGRDRLDVPLIIGSCGMAGGDSASTGCGMIISMLSRWIWTPAAHRKALHPIRCTRMPTHSSSRNPMEP